MKIGGTERKKFFLLLHEIRMTVWYLLILWCCCREESATLGWGSEVKKVGTYTEEDLGRR